MHVAGPCTTKDDNRMRRLAHAYDAFEPEHQTHLGDVRYTRSARVEVNMGIESSTGEPNDVPMFLANEQHPQASRSSSDRLNVQTLVPRTLSSKQTAIEAHDAVYKAPAMPALSRSLQYIEDTPLAAAALESQLFTSSLAMQQHQQEQSSPSPTRLPVSPGPEQGQDPEPDMAGQKNTPPSSPPRAAPSSPEPEDIRLPPTVHRALSAAPTSSAERGPEQEEGAKPIASRPDPTTTPPAHPRSSPTLLPLPPLSSDPAPTSPNDTDTYRVIMPPPAPVGLLDISYSHITPPFAQLTEHLPPSKYWEPIAHINRLPERTERGHWGFCIDTWSVDLRAEFWTFLKDFVEHNRAGWGVSCFIRAPEAGDEGTLQEGGSFTEASRVFDFYCQGEVMMHVYLLLYVASQSRVRRVGAQWVDSAERVCVQMLWG